MSGVEVLFEDEYLLVINKPAGLVVNRAETVEGMTLQDWVEQKTGKGRSSEGEFGKRSGLVHRLDRDTSGVMVLALGEAVMFELMSQFKKRTTEKIYVALVHGKVKPLAGAVRLPLGRTTRDRRKFGVMVGGKMSETGYQVLKNFDSKIGGYQDGFSLVSLAPKSGRTHQLRVVMRHLGHPICGDMSYLGRKRASLDRKWCPRQFLHAKRLCFVHPVARKRMCFEAPLAEDLEEALNAVRKE